MIDSDTGYRVFVVDASVGHVVTSLNTPKVFELGFSPLGTFIITWQQPMKDENGDAVKNLKVWRTIDEQHAENRGEEQALVGKFVQKSQTNWNLQYTHDEKYCARSVSNEIQFYESGDLGTVWNKLRVEGVTDFAIAPGSTNRIAVFTPVHKVCGGFFCGEDYSADLGPRVNLLRSRSSMCLSLMLLCHRRISSKAIKFNSSGMFKGQVSLSKQKPKLINLARVIMGRLHCIFSAQPGILTLGSL